MARVTSTPQTRRRRKAVIKQAKGYFGAKSRLFKKAKEQVMKSQFYAYRDRKVRKRDFRKLWIQRINAALSQKDLSYSGFIHSLKTLKIGLNRKMLSEIAIHHPAIFEKLVQQATTATHT